MHLWSYSVHVYRQICGAVTIHNSLAKQKFCGERQIFHNSIVLNLVKFKRSEWNKNLIIEATPVQHLKL